MDRGGGAPNRRRKARMEALVAIRTGRFMQAREEGSSCNQPGGRRVAATDHPCHKVCRESSATSQGGGGSQLLTILAIRCVENHLQPARGEEGRREWKGGLRAPFLTHELLHAQLPIGFGVRCLCCKFP